MEKSKSRSILYKYKSIKEQAKEIQKMLYDISRQRLESTRVPYGQYASSGTLNVMQDDAESRTKSILGSYNSGKNDIENLFGINVPELTPSGKTSGALLQQIIIECDRIIGLAELSESDISPEDMDRLIGIRKELTEAWSDLDINFEKNLDVAIKEAEKGHSLASALITSRVVEYVLSQFKGKVCENENKKIEDVTIDDINKFLTENSIIKSGEEDFKGAIIKTSKKSRNFFSHRIDTFADSSDAQPLLGDTVKILEIYKRFISTFPR